MLKLLGQFLCRILLEMRQYKLPLLANSDSVLPNDVRLISMFQERKHSVRIHETILIFAFPVPLKDYLPLYNSETYRIAELSNTFSIIDNATLRFRRGHEIL